MAWSATKKAVVAAAVIGVLAGIGLAGGLVARAAEKKRNELTDADELIDEGAFEWSGATVEWILYQRANGSYRIGYTMYSQDNEFAAGDLCCYASEDAAAKAMLAEIRVPEDTWTGVGA